MCQSWLMEVKSHAPAQRFLSGWLCVNENQTTGNQCEQNGGLEGEGEGWLQWLDQEPLCSTKRDLKNLQSTFPKDCQSTRSEGRLGGEKTDLSLGGLLFLLPSYQVTVHKLLPIYSGISSWIPRSEGLIDRGVNKGCSPPLAVTIVKEEGEQ